jgi:branched-chain amino acid transport system permease protein
MNAYQLGLIMQSCISVLVVVAVFAITGLAGMFSIGQAAYMSISAYFAFILARTFGLPLILTAAIGIGISAFLAWIISIPTLKLRKDYFALITIGFGQITNAAIILLEKYTNGSIGYSRIPRVPSLLWIILGFTVVGVFAFRNLKYSRFGRMCIALKNDEMAARSFGIDVYKLKMKIYVLASAMAGLAGILVGLRTRVILPDMFSWSLSAEMQIFLFVGGTNSLTGAVLSSFFLKLMPEFFRGITIFGQSLQEYRTIIYCVLVLVIINYRPQGVFGEHELNLRYLKKVFKKAEKDKAEGNG